MHGLLILILCNEISYDSYNFIIFFLKSETFYLYKISIMDNVNRLESMHCLYKDRSSLLTSLLHGRIIWNRLVTAFYYILTTPQRAA